MNNISEIPTNELIDLRDKYLSITLSSNYTSDIANAQKCLMQINNELHRRNQ